jgi:tRNA(Phe) wybutosine-synthesizing methylase Tyw3
MSSVSSLDISVRFVMSTASCVGRIDVFDLEKSNVLIARQAVFSTDPIA